MINLKFYREVKFALPRNAKSTDGPNLPTYITEKKY